MDKIINFPTMTLALKSKHLLIKNKIRVSIKKPVKSGCNCGCSLTIYEKNFTQACLLLEQNGITFSIDE